MSSDQYTTPLGRYASREMQTIWSPDVKFQTWRRLWVSLAEAQQSMGLNITDAQIAEMRGAITNIDYEMARLEEKRVRHDVMAHIATFGHVAPLAKPIIHWGATSCYVTDNTEIIQTRRSLELLCVRVARVIARLQVFAISKRNLPTLGYTHFQPASLTTVGKRAAVWLQDLVMDLQAFEALRDNLLFLGTKGATGTQDTFLKLFNGNHGKVKELDRLVTEAAGFARTFPISGQTYTRKQDTRVVQALADFAASAHKACVDLRLLQHEKEIEEPFEKDQVGSSAMAYKRNPMRCERVCSLSRKLMDQAHEALQTHAGQWLERTLDDSAARRFFLPESFLLADSIALILQNVFEGLVVYPAMINRHVQAELPFMATEEIIMAMVQAGGDRQTCHERIRQHAGAAGDQVKQLGQDNDLLTRLKRDAYFSPVHNELCTLVNPYRFIGRAAEQVDEYMDECNRALLPYRDRLEQTSELHV